MELIPIELDRTRHVKADIGVLRKVDNYLKPKNLAGLLKNVGENLISLDVVVMFYYYALVWEDKALTDVKVEELITNAIEEGVSITEFIELMGEVFSRVWAIEENGKKLRKTIVR